jgi:hypothetical protein
MNSTEIQSAPITAALLPSALLTLPLSRLALDAAAVGDFATNGVLTVGDALQLPLHSFAADGAFAGRMEALQQALARTLHDGLCRFGDVDCRDWPTLRAQLLGPLDDDERAWFAEFTGLTGPVARRPELARAAGVTLAEIDDRAERVRSRIAELAGPLLARLRRELEQELLAGDGVVTLDSAAVGSLLPAIAAAGQDRALGLRLFAFLFPRELHLHRGTLFRLAPRRFRQLLRRLPALVPPQRLPVPVDTLMQELVASGDEMPRGALLHVLRSEAHITIELDERHGEVAAADPRSPSARLVDLLTEARQPMTLTDLVFAYRDRFRTASRRRLENQLRASRAFVQTGPECWALRRWLERELAAVAPLVDKAARRLQTGTGRTHISELLREERCDERTTWLVLDRLADDPRVRLLGRGEACAATHRRSRVLDELLRAFRRAAGDVITSMFVANQPEPRRRLVERLLRHNRLFVQPAPDRIDTLSNYPLNDERLRRLIVLVQEQLRSRAGHATAAGLKALVDRSELGGAWLTPELLTDVLRRHGPFEVLPGGVIASAELELTQRLRRTVRQALREAGTVLSVEEVLQARPELGAFAGCLGELLRGDPLLQTPDGRHFVLA